MAKDSFVKDVDLDGWKKVEPTQAPTFRFVNEGDTLIGTYEQFKSNVGPNSSMLYFIREDSGKEWVVWGSEILDRRFESIKPKQVVKIVYLGKKKSEKSNREYHDYEVYSKD